MNTDVAIVELYGLEPEQFVAARNELARLLRERDEPAAAAIMALRKPTVAAWLANQLVRAAPDQIHALTELGDELRESYLTAGTARRRELTRRRHDLVRDLVDIARQRAAGGRRVTEQTADRLTETLDAALVDPAAARLLRSGQLTSALRHVGFGVVDENGDPAALAAIPPRVVRRSQPAKNATKPSGKPLTKTASTVGSGRPEKSRPRSAKAVPAPVDRTLERRAAQRRRFEQAEADYVAAAADRDEAERALDSHQHRVHDLEADVIRLNEELEQTRQNLREARKQLPRLQRRFNLADRNATAVQKRRDTDQRRLQATEPPSGAEQQRRTRHRPD